MADDSTAEDETPDEEEEAADTGATPQEAHREVEFDDIIQRLTALSQALGSIQDILMARPGEPATPAGNDDDADDDQLVDVDKLDV